MRNTPSYRSAVWLAGLAFVAVACSGPTEPWSGPTQVPESSASPPPVDLEALEQLPIIYHVTADDLDPWPFTFDQGTLVCDGSGEFRRVFITPIPSPPDDSGIAINEEARRTDEVHAPRPSEWALDEQWTGDNPELEPLLEAGFELCAFHDLKAANGIDTRYGNAADFADRES
jgi:hypothetical protein